MERLERLVVVQGVENPLDTPAAHDLLRTVVLWEAGGLRPRWDVARGGEDRRAIAPGLVGEFRNSSNPTLLDTRFNRCGCPIDCADLHGRSSA